MRWSDSFSSGGEQRSWGGVRFGSRLVDSRKRKVSVPAAVAFEPIRRIGGDTGWYYGNWLWKIRGFMDLLVGGVGVRRGRRHPRKLRVGDVLDFWRVEEIIDNKLLRLSAEMLVPGRAWLEFEVKEEDGESTVRQTAIFDPVGLFGILYWYALFPVHEFVFRGMLRYVAECLRSRGNACLRIKRHRRDRTSDPVVSIEPVVSLHRHIPEFLISELSALRM